jgi:hypothetical protein
MMMYVKSRFYKLLRKLHHKLIYDQASKYATEEEDENEDQKNSYFFGSKGLILRSVK